MTETPSIRRVRNLGPEEAGALLIQLLNYAREKRQLARSYTSDLLVADMQGRNTAYLNAARLVGEALGLTDEEYQGFVEAYTDRV